MKRVNLFVLGIILCAVLAACSGSPSRGTEVENPDLDAAAPIGYTNAALSIRIDLPAEWTYTEEEGEVIFQGPQGSLARLTFEESDVTPDTLDDFLMAERPGVPLGEYAIDKLVGALITGQQWDAVNQMWTRELFIPLCDVQQLGRMEFLYRLDDVSAEFSIASEKDRLTWSPAVIEYMQEHKGGPVSQIVEVMLDLQDYQHGAGLNLNMFQGVSP